MRRNLLKVLSVGALALATGASLASCSQTSDDNTLVIGLECNYAPFNWTETSGANSYTLPIANFAGEYADGYDIQFAKRIESEMGVNVKIMKLEWDNLIPQLNANQIDCIIAGMTDTEERRQSISFTNEYYRSELVLVTSKAVADEWEGKTVTAADATSFFTGHGVVSQISTVTDDVIDTFASNYGATHLTCVDTFATASQQVSSGAAFAMTSEYPVAQSIVAANSNLGIVHISQDILGVDLSDLGVSIGIRKGETELQAKLNAVLANYSQEQRNADMSAAVTRSGE